jgi:hypothetical protein
MKRVFIILVFIVSFVFGAFNASISPINSDIKKRMIRGNSWHTGCPVPISDLRYIRVVYHDFSYKDRVGELIVHKSIANEIVWIFEELYSIGYPIRQMRLISDFGGSDWKSIEADNTSAFNCRRATGSKKWSKHAFGRAIDINPLENPYISKTGHISHRASLKYKKRFHKDSSPSDRAVLLPRDEATLIFKSYGFKWGGDWRYIKDYQHFFK